MTNKAYADTRETGDGGETAELPQLCHNVTENAPLPMVAVEGAGHIVRYVNPAFCRLAGKSKEELVGKSFALAVPEGENNGSAALLERVYRIGITESLADQEHASDFFPAVYWSYTMWAVLASDGRTAGVMIQVQIDAHGEHRAEVEALNARLQQTNEALTLSNVRQHEETERAELLNARLYRAMQESHHRIKNNLQVISALVEIQIGETGEAAGDAYLKRIYQHIRTLASIHDLLTQQAKHTGEANDVGTRAVLGRLIPMLEETSGGRRIKAEIADARLSVNKAASLCLLVSECVSNAIKHSKGEIEITLRLEGGRAQLEICDDGSGFPSDFDWRKAANTGLSLIDGTARHDLRGEARYENHANGGGRVAITFPVPAPKNSDKPRQEIYGGEA